MSCEQEDLEYLMELTESDCYKSLALSRGTFPSNIATEVSQAWRRKEKNEWLEDYNERVICRQVLDGVYGIAPVSELRYAVKAVLKNTYSED